MNKYNPKIHHRRSIRLKGYDYAQAGLYYITICTQNRACLFGEIQNGEMNLNDAGKMVENEWFKLPQRFQNIQLREYIVMPNHFHAILEILGATLVVAPNNNTVAPTALGGMIGAFESITTVEYIRGVKNNNWKPFNGKLWQRNYWEHIIRSEQSYNRISKYIFDNPENWKSSKLYDGK
jgi:REP element-mobilizing transposase RayT